MMPVMAICTSVFKMGAGVNRPGCLVRKSRVPSVTSLMLIVGTMPVLSDSAGCTDSPAVGLIRRGKVVIRTQRSRRTTEERRWTYSMVNLGIVDGERVNDCVGNRILEELDGPSRIRFGAGQLPEAGSVISGDGSVAEGSAREGNSSPASEP